MRLWESLALGAMPIIEKGIGLDKTLYKLPALLVDDFASITPALIRRAYVEALYHADEWEYERLSRKWYNDLIYQCTKVFVPKNAFHNFNTFINYHH